MEPEPAEPTPMDLFEGAEDVPEAARAAIAKNFERLMTRSVLAAADMAMDTDVVLVAEAPDGSEERVRASSAILQRCSTGLRGLLQTCPGEEVRLTRSNSSRLHPAGAIRFVIAVVHAEAANKEAMPTADGLRVPPPPLDILLDACLLADCWDFPPALRALARCLRTAVDNEGDMARKASSLAKLLGMAHGRESSADWQPLLEAVEEAIAQVLPLYWIPFVLKAFDLEQAARVINRIEDSELELTPIVLPGGKALERVWHDNSEKKTVWTSVCERQQMKRARGALARQPETHACGHGSFTLKVQLGPMDPHKVGEAQQAVDRVEQVIGSMQSLIPGVSISEELLEMRADAAAKLKAAECRQVSVFLEVDPYYPALLTAATTLRIKSQATCVERSYTRDEIMPGGQSVGYENMVGVEELGLTTCTVHGTAVVSKLQRQCAAEPA